MHYETSRNREHSPALQRSPLTPFLQHYTLITKNKREFASLAEPDYQPRIL